MSIIIFKNNELLSNFVIDNYHLHSENFIENLSNIIKEKGFSLDNFSSLYLLSSPIVSTGLKLSIVFSITLFELNNILNKKLEIFYIDVLDFQACQNKAISSISIAGKKKIFITKKYQNSVNQDISSTTLKLSRDEQEIFLLENKDYDWFCDLEKTIFLNNFLKMKKLFKKTNPNELFSLVDD